MERRELENLLRVSLSPRGWMQGKLRVTLGENPRPSREEPPSRSQCRNPAIDTPEGCAVEGLGSAQELAALSMVHGAES